MKKRLVIAGDPPLTEIMALYLEEADNLRSPVTAKNHAKRIGKWVAQYRASEAETCAAHIVKDLRKAYKPATINKSLSTLKRGLTIAKDLGRIRENYGEPIRRLAEKNEREVFPTLEQVQYICDRASFNTRVAVWTSLLTGCRRGEVCQITKADIRKDTILIRHGNTKTEKTRTVPIVPALRPWLPYLPLKVNFEGLKSGWRRAVEKAKMEQFNFHDLRHSCATILLELEVPLDVVRDILGHTTIKTTERYAHAIVKRQRSALELLGGQVDLHQTSTPAEQKAA